MLVNKGYKYRIYPTKEQQQMLAAFFGCCRFVYNRCLDLRKSAYEADKRKVSAAECMRYVTKLRSGADTAWLAGCDSMALQEAVKDLDRAYRNFFEKRAGYPRFKKKYASEQSYRTRNQNNGIRIADRNHIRIPVAGTFKAKISRIPEGRILNATISRSCSGKYFISICVEEEVVPKPNNGCMTGIDVGIKVFYTDSNGNTVDAPKPLKALEKKLRREQKKLSRMIEADIAGYTGHRRPVFKRPLSECRNIQKQRAKVARVHEHIRDIRLDFLHKVSTALVNENQVIGIEHLNVKGMVRNRRLAKAISDVSWSTFFNLLEYKAYEHGCTVIKVPTFFPSSQTCTCCGYKNPLVKDLSVRDWTCPVCGTVHDRDENAAENILKKALEMLEAS